MYVSLLILNRHSLTPNVRFEHLDSGKENTSWILSGYHVSLLWVSWQLRLYVLDKFSQIWLKTIQTHFHRLIIWLMVTLHNSSVGTKERACLSEKVSHNFARVVVGNRDISSRCSLTCRMPVCFRVETAQQAKTCETSLSKRGASHTLWYVHGLPPSPPRSAL